MRCTERVRFVDFPTRQHRVAVQHGAVGGSVVGYEYDRASRRTKTVYLGSVCADGNPDHLEQTLRLLTGNVLNGQPAQATAGNLEAVRDWLERHGSYRRRPFALEEERAAARRVREEHERQQVERIPAELRERLEAQ